MGLTFQSSEAHVFFKAGKNRDRYFYADDLFQQVENAIDIFKSKQMGLQLAFSCLIMLPATKDEHLMLAQHGRCQKAPM